LKLILSRKGVDSSAGGFASPIFPDGSMLTIPIPDKRSDVRYRDIQSPFAEHNRKYSKLVRDLSGGKITGSHRVHLDPDLMHQSLARSDTWQPLFGQCGAAQSHLNSHEVARGDVFLFFGWFKQVEWHARKWRYLPGAPDLHVMFAWLQVGAVHKVDDVTSHSQYSWMRYHPHCRGNYIGDNVIYEAAKQLRLDRHRYSGAGSFEKFDSALCLTAQGKTRSNWCLPKWFYPQPHQQPLSYHTDLDRWSLSNNNALLRAAARGQEFVLDAKQYPQVKSWLQSLLDAS